MEPRPGQLTFGYRHEWGSDLPCFILPEDRRQHVYVIGQTGTGKSTLLLNCITQDIEQGRGVAVIDPHGDLALDVLSRIPKWRTEDVVYLDAAAESPVTLNLFRASGSNWYLVASGIVSAFKKIWGQSWGARMEYILFATLAALIQCDNTSLLGVSRMLYDPAYRAWVVHQVKDPLVRSFWVNEFAGYDKRFLQEVVAPIQNKVGQILFAPPIRNMLGQVASRINFRFMMDHGRILVANLAKGHLGVAHSSLLGALLVTD
jgi:energy-coupling factor transporter ATP-binding protein EcfA2